MYHFYNGILSLQFCIVAIFIHDPQRNIEAVFINIITDKIYYTDEVDQICIMNFNSWLFHLLITAIHRFLAIILLEWKLFSILIVTFYKINEFVVKFVPKNINYL